MCKSNLESLEFYIVQWLMNYGDSAVFALLCTLWMERNARVFEDKADHCENLWEKIELQPSSWAANSKRVYREVLVEMSSNDDSQHSTIPSNDVDHHHNNMAPDVANQGGTEYNHEIGEEEARNILEVIASTGKFWHDWDKLKSLLSFQLKQVLSEYSESKMTSEQQVSSLGETYSELVTRLDEALSTFEAGPPFTLQRVCEILLTARSIYPNLSKLALALEKNLLVTSTLMVSTDPYPPAVIQKPEEIEKSEKNQSQPNTAQNEAKHVTTDEDEAMTEAEAGGVVDDMTINMEAFEEIVESTEPKSGPTAGS